MALPHVKFADEQTKQERERRKTFNKGWINFVLLLNCELAFLWTAKYITGVCFYNTPGGLAWQAIDYLGEWVDIV